MLYTQGVVGSLFVKKLPRVFTCFVGADSWCERNGITSPVFEDGSFEYIPIPENISLLGIDEKCPHLVRYRDVPIRSGLPITRFIDPKQVDQPAHYDPEFETFTYGDHVNKPRAAKLKMAETGDLLFFISRLKLWRGGRFTERAGHYVIGFIEIESVLKGIPYIERLERLPSNIAEFTKNAHVRRCLCGADERTAWVFKGSSRSRLFDVAVPFTLELASKIFENVKLKSSRTELQILASHLRTCRLLSEEKSLLFLDYVERYIGCLP